MHFDTPLPIDAVLGELGAALERGTAAVLVALPGAGKTTRVPLALTGAEWVGDRKILVLEPRRLAARAGAERMARSLGESVGGTVGLRARLGSRIGPRTRIEVITEGVFTRMILDDPALEGVGAVLFDEFHERSLDADLGLALALDARNALREDLRLLVMSATLDGARVAELIGDAPVIRSEGRAFPVETRYLGRDPAQRIEDRMTAATREALRSEPGSVLAFLPGQREIRRVAERLSERVADPEVSIVQLHGGLELRAQAEAISPAAPGRRKVVLATSIAETSLTIEGVRIVIDSGLARVPRYEPGAGVTRLATVRVSRASADQRRGRAGRTEPGVCYRLWDEPATASLPAHAEPEIRNADLSGLLLDCAAWGVADPRRLAWLDPPAEAPLAAARGELQALGALDPDGRITELGRRMRALPLPPRLARMILVAAGLGAAGEAAEIGAVLVERGLGGDDTDLDHRLAAFRRDGSRRADDMRKLAHGWARSTARGAPAEQPPAHAPSTASLLALAYPDRIAKARGAPGQFLLANGRGASLDASDPLARSPFLVVAELHGAAAASRILLAAAIDEAEVLDIAGPRITETDEITFDRGAALLRARRVRRLGAITLASEPRPVPAETAAGRLAEGIASIGIERLPWSKAQQQIRERVQFLRQVEPGTWPDLSDAALTAMARDWLAPFIEGRTRLDEITPGELAAALEAFIPWSLRRRLDAEAPTHFTAPAGHAHVIRYDGPGAPSVHIRVQELFGLDRHPSIAGGRLPLTLHLLSPAHRPIQITRDLPGFWRGSWAAVRAEMKGRYPKHSWPDDPLTAAPTARAKPRTS
ncbi:MAG: ATP-dependent helicase HrpB [Hyphomicrobiaceae bacterium]|nr:ATP-dependent helicase HrpB [Hyphomicrobiaceae bacterium]